MLPVLNRLWIEDNVCTTASLLVTLISEPGLSFNVILRNSKLEIRDGDPVGDRTGCRARPANDTQVVTGPRGGADRHNDRYAASFCSTTSDHPVGTER